MKKVLNTVVVLFLAIGMIAFVARCNNNSNNNPATASCSDGIKNQSETGIDCGGPCAACGTSPTCSDGIQNQGETGVDCGGPCTACVVQPCYNGVQDGSETAVDCGGSSCSTCPTIFINGKLGNVPFHYSNPGASGPEDGSFNSDGAGNSNFSAGGLISSQADLQMWKYRVGIFSYPTHADYLALYAPGTYGYWSGANNSSGADLFVVDANGKYWETTGQSNTGKTITISSCSAWNSTYNYVIYKGSFNCNVKCSDSVGIVKTLTGSFSMYGYVAP